MASSGLESSLQHGLTISSSRGILEFARNSLNATAQLALPFINDAYRISEDITIETSQMLEELVRLDALYAAMVLSHVAKRASRAQGSALLSLYTKALSPPGNNPTNLLIETLRSKLHTTAKIGSFEGHLPICWAMICSALRLSLGTLWLCILPFMSS